MSKTKAIRPVSVRRFRTTLLYVRTCAAAGVLLIALSGSALATPAPASDVTRPTGISATVTADGALIGWTPVQGATGYAVYRSMEGQVPVLVDPAPVTGSQTLDVGLRSGTTYTWAVQALFGHQTPLLPATLARASAIADERDASADAGQVETTTATAQDPLMPYRDLMTSTCPAPTMTVSTSAQLRSALANAQPGDSIHLADGVFKGTFELSHGGTTASPVWLCGSREAILDSGSLTSGTALRIDGVKHVGLSGFTVQDALQGVMVKASEHMVITGLTVKNIGYEGIHLYDFSNDAVVEDNDISDTGSHDVAYGEGIYIGTSDRRWDVVTDGQPDTTHEVLLLRNRITNAGAEPIEAKPGTYNGIIQDNILTGHQPGSRAIGWVLVTGNDWLVRGNAGQDAVTNGYVLMRKGSTWGLDNVVVDNRGVANSPGWGVLVQHPGSPVAPGTIVGCDNVITGAASGLSTVDCQN